MPGLTEEFRRPVLTRQSSNRQRQWLSTGQQRGTQGQGQQKAIHAPIPAFYPVFAVRWRASTPALLLLLPSSGLRLGHKLGWCNWAWVVAGSACMPVPPSMLLPLTAALPIAAAPAAAAAVVAGTVRVSPATATAAASAAARPQILQTHCLFHFAPLCHATSISAQLLCI
jgi:hypothetical protein